MKLLLPLILLFTTLSIKAESNTYAFFDNALTLSLPSDLNLMTEQELTKYYSGQKLPPSSAFANNDNSVTLTLTQYPMQADKKSMRKIQNALSGMLRKAHENAKWKKDKVINEFGTKVAIFEYEIETIGQYHYYLTYALPIKNQLTMLTFLTTEKKYKTKWLTQIRELMNTISIEKQ